MRLCHCCQIEKPETKFTSKRKGAKCYRCVKDQTNRNAREFRLKHQDAIRKKRKERFDKNPEKAREYARDWRKKNKNKCTLYNMTWRHKSPENMRKHIETAKKYQKRIRQEKGPVWLLKKMRRHFRRICNGAKAKKSFQYIGVSSVEEFISIMTSKTDNLNWMQDGYEIDHLWQMNWFEEFCLSKPDSFEELYHTAHHHSNVRPLTKKDNAERSFYDFSCLNEADFKRFAPFLNENVKKAMVFYFQYKHLFSGNVIKKCSREEESIKGQQIPS